MKKITKEGNRKVYLVYYGLAIIVLAFWFKNKEPWVLVGVIALIAAAMIRQLWLQKRLE